jgi:hypothetical protein
VAAIPSRALTTRSFGVTRREFGDVNISTLLSLAALGGLLLAARL